MGFRFLSIMEVIGMAEPLTKASVFRACSVLGDGCGWVWMFFSRSQKAVMNMHRYNVAS
jgi:hypothetical protein